jgi:hypothetical protein
MSKDVQGTARLCKEREVLFSQFCGGVVQLVRTLPRQSLESYTVTAKSLPRSKTSRAQRIYAYIKDALRSIPPALATRINEMPHLDRLRFKTTYVFLQLAVPSRQSLVLSQVLRP